MTSLIAIKYGNLEDQVTVTEDAVISESGATLCGIKPGDTLTLEQLLYGLMLPPEMMPERLLLSIWQEALMLLPI